MMSFKKEYHRNINASMGDIENWVLNLLTCMASRSQTADLSPSGGFISAGRWHAQRALLNTCFNRCTREPGREFPSKPKLCVKRRLPLAAAASRTFEENISFVATRTSVTVGDDKFFSCCIIKRLVQPKG
jgi:hypothetical protein